MHLRLAWQSFVYWNNYELLKIDSFRLKRFTLICCINVIKPVVITNAFVYLPGTNKTTSSPSLAWSAVRNMFSSLN